MKERAKCPLCSASSSAYFESKISKFHQCSNCRAIFVDKYYLPDKNIEIERYCEHNNDVNDVRYQNFVNPIVGTVLKYFNNMHSGLDFGAGTGPVISKMLTERGYNIEQYDPFFHYHPELLHKKYDFIVSCEVIEHFHFPGNEFQLLKDMLVPGGKLICMTSIYDESIDFSKWYYKNDPTHVFFYQKDTLRYIMKKFGFSNLKTNKNLVIFTS